MSELLYKQNIKKNELKKKILLVEDKGGGKQNQLG